VLAQHTRLLTNLEKGQKELLQSVNLLLGKNDEAIPTVPGDMELPLATLDDMAQMEDKLSDKAVENTLVCTIHSLYCLFHLDWLRSHAVVMCVCVFGRATSSTAWRGVRFISFLLIIIINVWYCYRPINCG